MEITEFKSGDIITRTEPVIEYSSGYSFFDTKPNIDYTCVGKRLELITIANGLIYLKNGDNVVELYEHKFKDGWEKYVEV